jgi:hypothetical protein
MRTNTKLRSSERPCSFDHFLHTLGHQPAPALRPIPRTLRDHIGKREFGDFGAVLLADLPPATDLTDRVRKWRTIEAVRQHDVPLHTRYDYAAEDRRFNVLFVVVPTAIMVWVLIGLTTAWLRGLL